MKLRFATRSGVFLEEILLDGFVVFGLSLGKGFLTESPTLMTLSFCILMSLNVTFANIWGIMLKEWKGCSKKTIFVLVTGIAVLIISSFLPELLK